MVVEFDLESCMDMRTASTHGESTSRSKSSRLKSIRISGHTEESLKTLEAVKGTQNTEKK